MLRHGAPGGAAHSDTILWSVALCRWSHTIRGVPLIVLTRTLGGVSNHYKHLADILVEEQTLQHELLYYRFLRIRIAKDVSETSDVAQSAPCGDAGAPQPYNPRSLLSSAELFDKFFIY